MSQPFVQSANIWTDSRRSYGGFVRSNFSDFTLSEKPSVLARLPGC